MPRLRPSTGSALAVVGAVALCIGLCGHLRAGPVITLGFLVALRYAVIALVAVQTTPLWSARRRVANDPTDAAAYYRLSRALHDKGKTPEAIRAFRNAIQLDPSLDITRPRDAAEELALRFGQADRHFISSMCALSSMDYLVEEARRESVRLKDILSPAESSGPEADDVLAECAGALESVGAEIAELEAASAESAGAAALGPEGDRRRELHLRFLRRLADRISDLKGRIERGEV